MVTQVLALVGAVLVLAAYVALQRGWLTIADRRYHALNAIGAACLTWVALGDRRWGFVLLEGAWALLALPGWVRPPRRP